jgi:D-arabinose 1-dehydrogenase-like Zn-dependent alcohol dehydrogenase
MSMRALVYDAFGEPPVVRMVAEPECPADGVIVSVQASGLCRSDWHAWSGHDPDVTLPHIGGHEYAGVVAEVGPDVHGWTAGQRVTVPFVCACGACEQCSRGDQQICDRQVQPGFDLPGSFAEFVAVPHAGVNLVVLPDTIETTAAAALGCRFATAYRAIIQQGRVLPGEWTVVHGCGGVGLSAIQIAVSRGARVVAIDPSAGARAAAAAFGAELVLDGSVDDEALVAGVLDATGGGAHLSVDAFGSASAFTRSIAGLRKRGRHVQVGLMTGADSRPALDAGAVLSRELEIIGSHGMAAHSYDLMFGDILAGLLDPAALVRRTLDLDEAGSALSTMDTAPVAGVSVILPR